MRATWLMWAATVAWAADWPEWRGAGRAGVFTETGILERFPAGGLRVKWRAPVRSGFAGPAVSGGRVYVVDYEMRSRPRGVERAMAIEEASGRALWTREWDADYTGIATSYATGPRATPTVEGDRVYVLGAQGALLCLDARSGAVRWRRDCRTEFGTQVPVWGMAGAPLVEGDRLIVVAGGTEGRKVVALDKHTGREAWHALDSESEPGYSAPVVIEVGGRRQVVVWHAGGVAGLDPGSGRVLWEQGFRVNLGLAVATPVWRAPYLLVSSFYNGSLLMELGLREAGARMVWRGASASEIQTDGLHALVSTPVIDGEHIYGICSYGQLRCLELRTGRRVWESLAVTREKARWATGFIVRHGQRYFINNDRGELILAQLKPSGYEEISRTALVEPTTTGGIGRRELGAVNWSHPAYANGHIFARNDRELVCASLSGGE